MLLVTRAAPDAERTVDRLRKQGVEAVAAPCLAYSTLGPDEELLATVHGREADFLLASPRAGRAFAALEREAQWRVLALAPATTVALREAGVAVDVAVHGGGAALAAAARPGLVVALTSDQGGDEVRRIRPDALFWVAYRTTCPPRLPRRAVMAMREPFDLLFASPSAVNHFERLAPGRIADARTIFAHGATTADAVRRAGRAAAPSPWGL
jgi:uroporphyrinogen-III synthase